MSSFKSNRFEKAIIYFKAHLKKSSIDYQVRNLLGASYYYSGEPEKALIELKKVALKTKQRDINYYFQGLCYLAIEDTNKAILAFEYAARFSSGYGERSAIEAAVLSYHQNNYKRAKYWADAYLKVYPQGKHRASAKNISEKSEKKTYDPNLKGPEKIDPYEMLYRYSHESLTPKPHYWYSTIGFNYRDTVFQSPKGAGANAVIVATPDTKFHLLAEAGIGFGPITQGRNAGFYGGYNYRQNWISAQDRMEEFLSSYDFEYFIFRADLLKRSHELYGYFTRRILEKTELNFRVVKTITKLGSSLVPHPDNEQLQVVLNVSDTTTLRPSIRHSINKNFIIEGYSLFRRNVEYDDPTLSNQSYFLESEDAISKFSFGAIADNHFPKYASSLKSHIFALNFYFNDPYYDLQRLGVKFDYRFKFMPKLDLLGSIQYSNDTYVQEIPKRGQCSRRAGSSDTETQKSCPRIDTTQYLSIGGDYKLSRSTSIYGHIDLYQNTNAVQKEYDKQYTEFFIAVVYGFPSAHTSRTYANSTNPQPYEIPYL